MSKTNKPNAAALIGLWRLEEAALVDEQDCRIGPAFGDDPQGYIAYMAGGRMISVIADAAQQKLSGDRLSAPAEERAAAFSAANAYAGRYRVDGNKVVHTVEVCTNPNWVGTEVVRYIELVGDRAIYRTEPQPLGGATSVVRLVWTRQIQSPF